MSTLPVAGPGATQQPIHDASHAYRSLVASLVSMPDEEFAALSWRTLDLVTVSVPPRVVTAR